MIIPIRCMNCGHTLADIWLWYQREVIRIRAEQGLGGSAGTPMYMDGTSIPKTAEKQVLDELGLDRYCCRSKLLTHVDLSTKV
jgi:DNA-directed RNA polymerase subunit N (RpoN/RPB10)